MILIVDDEFDIVMLLMISLEKLGLLVSIFTDPLIALKEFNSHNSSYDLVLSDVRMPHMNGYELVQQVKKIKPDIKVLIMSSFEFDLDQPNNFLRSDITEFIEKPITIERLSKIVLTHIHT